MADTIQLYRKFIENLVGLTAGGPPACELVHAIETDTVNLESVHNMLSGFQFESYTSPLQHVKTSNDEEFV